MFECEKDWLYEMFEGVQVVLQLLELQPDNYGGQNLLDLGFPVGQVVLGMQLLCQKLGG